MAISHTLQLSPLFDLSAYDGGGELVGFDTTPGQNIITTYALKPMQYYWAHESGCAFPVSKPDQPQDYNVVEWERKGGYTTTKIRNELFNIHATQLLPRGELLLVCSRTRQHKHGQDCSQNGRVYSESGKLVREFSLNDGIEDVQTTREGVIWTSFFDEGVFSDGTPPESFSEFGLVARSAEGKHLYHYLPVGGLGGMVDCYALNVASNSETWCYFYTEFALVKIKNMDIEDFWFPGVRGSHAFAIDKSNVVFFGDYENRNRLHCYQLHESERSTKEKIVEVFDENGHVPEISYLTGRSDKIFFVSQSKVYVVSVRDALNA